MSDIDIPIFIATPLAGQGEVFNEDWMRARIDLFEAVTLPSMLTQLKDGVHWMIFIGEETPEIVRVRYRESRRPSSRVFDGTEEESQNYDGLRSKQGRFRPFHNLQHCGRRCMADRAYIYSRGNSKVSDQ